MDQLVYGAAVITFDLGLKTIGAIFDAIGMKQYDFGLQAEKIIDFITRCTDPLHEWDQPKRLKCGHLFDRDPHQTPPFVFLLRRSPARMLHALVELSELRKTRIFWRFHPKIPNIGRSYQGKQAGDQVLIPVKEDAIVLLMIIQQLMKAVTSKRCSFHPLKRTANMICDH